MLLSDLERLSGARCLTGEYDDREIACGYTCDLLSHVMGRGQPDMAWITVQAHMNVIAVAALLDFACVIIPEKLPVEAAIVEKAKDSGVLGSLVKPVQETKLFPAIEIAMSRWREMQGLEQELAGLRDSLAMRKTLDRAKGILMAAHHLSEPEAYRRIQQYAMMKRLTVKEVSEAIVKAAGGKV